MSGKHVMLSYQWDIQDTVKHVFEGLKSMGIPVWMDIEGGIKGNINDSMALGVDGAAVVCPFMTAKYQESKNCKKELNYADAQDVEIVPIMAEKSYKATQWLGIITAGMLWIDFRSTDNLPTRIKSLAQEIIQQAGDKLTIGAPNPTAGAAAMPQAVLEKKPGRAFRHKLTGKYLAESGQVKFHPASGERSTLVLCDQPQDTSYWVEEKKGGDKTIHFYKNYSSNGYLGYDANGDYTYTKAQHYGAEEWTLMADDQSTSGERTVVLFANYGKKYLAVRNGKFTGVGSYAEDCIWILD